jgi:hypothetical protein
MANWQVIRAEDKTVINPNLLMGEQDARDYMRVLAQETGKIYFVRPAPDLNWRDRELRRLVTGEYESLPWCAETWWAERPEEMRHHYAHVSKEKEAFVAYTESPEKGEQDRQTRCKAGVYLTRFFSEVLTPKEIQEWTRILQGERDDSDLSFSIARTPDEIEEVYTNGPASCMSGTDFDCEEHPTRVYGDSDLAIAYIKKPSDYHDEDIASRALIWPERKIYGRIYPTPDRYDTGARRDSANREYERLLRALKREGYSQGDFSGAYIRAIEGPRDGSFIMPYLDGGYYVTPVMRDGEDFFRMGTRGDYCASETCGVIYPRGRFVCERCEDHCDEDETYTVNTSRHSSEQWCESCYEHSTFYCHGHDETYSDNCESVEGPSGETVSLYYAESRLAFCERDEVWCEREDVYEVHVHAISGMTESWGAHARDNNAFYCAGTDSYYDSSVFESVTIDGETYLKEHAEGDLILRAKLHADEEESESLESMEG